MNPRYELAAPLFSSNYKQYDNIILGDSTMMYSSLYPGWMDKNITFSYAIYANTLCDVLYQLSSINVQNPLLIILGTTGGNDLARKIPINLIIDSAIQLLIVMKERWPDAKIVFIGIHPTEIEYVNLNKNYLNGSIRATLMNFYPSACFVDPAIVFNNAFSAPHDLMLDQIHYGPWVSFQIMDLIFNQCKVKF